MSESNKKLWDSVCVTDPEHVKPITGKDYSGSSPKPYWLVERATDVFGPCGIGWGIQVVSERFERFSDDDALHIALVRVWYEFEGKRGTVEQMGQTKATYRTSSGKFKIDEDAPKKSVTDGMVKCLSLLGFAGDIFGGRWDDSKYVEWAAQQYDPIAKLLSDFVADLVQLHTEGHTLEAVRKWYEERPANTNEAVEEMWSQLREYSDLRSAIKANKPETKA